ncbi:hypothetical protein [Pseudomonas sp. fls2-241-R2A-110]
MKSCATQLKTCGFALAPGQSRVSNPIARHSTSTARRSIATVTSRPWTLG